MGKIGSYEYPGIKLSKAIDIVKVIEAKLGGKVESKENLANLLGHVTVNSGGFINKVIGTKRYGLISGRGTFTVTPLGERLANPTGKGEEIEARKEIINNIPLFKKIYDRFGLNPDENNFWVQLNEITKCGRLDAQKNAVRILKLYKDVTKYLSEGDKNTQSKIESDKMSVIGEGNVSSNMMHFQSGSTILRLEKTDDNIDLLINAIESLKKDEKKNKKKDMKPTF